MIPLLYIINVSHVRNSITDLNLQEETYVRLIYEDIVTNTHQNHHLNQKSF